MNQPIIQLTNLIIVGIWVNLWIIVDLFIVQNYYSKITKLLTNYQLCLTMIHHYQLNQSSTTKNQPFLSILLPKKMVHPWFTCINPAFPQSTPGLVPSPPSPPWSSPPVAAPSPSAWRRSDGLEVFKIHRNVGILTINNG